MSDYQLRLDFLEGQLEQHRRLAREIESQIQLHQRGRVLDAKLAADYIKEDEGMTGGEMINALTNIANGHHVVVDTVRQSKLEKIAKRLAIGPPPRAPQMAVVGVGGGGQGVGYAAYFGTPAEQFYEGLSKEAQEVLKS